MLRYKLGCLVLWISLFTNVAFTKGNGSSKGQKSEKDRSSPDTPTMFELEDIAAVKQSRQEEREAREREEKVQAQREEASRKETTHSEEEGMIEKCGYRGWRRGWHISITLKAQEGAHDKYLTNSNEEATVDFVKEF